MPFTLAHPAAVVFWPRRWLDRLDTPALVIGTLLPDLIYYFPSPAALGTKLTHSLLGLLVYCLPLGWALWLGLQALAYPLAHVLGRSDEAPLRSKGLASGMSEGVTVSLCLVAGALSHLLWDGFTHRYGWFVRMMPFLQDRLPPLQMPIYSVLQHLSGVIGLALLTIWMWRRSRMTDWRGRYWLGVLLVSTIGAILLLPIPIDLPVSASWERIAVPFAVRFTTISLSSVALTLIYFKIKNWPP